MSFNIPEHLTGLTDAEVARSHEKFGYNQMTAPSKNTWWNLLLDILKEPMLILLIVIAVIYLVAGNYGESLFMLAAIILVSGISFYQDNRSKKALEALEKLNEPLSKVIRNSRIVELPTHEIAVGDLCITEEGKMINADGRIMHSNDFSVNESSLTGESFAVFKDSDSVDPQVYSGTLTVSGLAVFKVEATGKTTRLGKIGESIIGIKDEKSPLQLQIEKFVKSMAIIGIIVFLLVCAVNYYNTRNIVDSLLNGLTLAMSILPEEIPVAFTTFMALGAWKLMREGIIIKKSSIVETLGSTTVICTDKTGTITENSMHLKAVYDFRTNRVYEDTEFRHGELSEVISYAMWSSEPVPFDPMEKTLHRVYAETHDNDLRKDFSMFHEYPLDGKPPMMTHFFENGHAERIIAAKGAPEAILKVSNLTESERSMLRNHIDDLGNEGYRILGVAKSDFAGNGYPKQQQELPFEFLGLVVFQDPPKKGIQEVFRQIDEAGIKVKVITGDNAQTTKTIAGQSGIKDADQTVSGEEIASVSEDQLRITAAEKVLFTRMFPEAKLAVVNALKKNGEVVAMLGDGVNDGPALKAAHIGVAMGVKGTEIAKAAASLVLTNDDLGKLLTGIAAGRRIYTNIKKAVQYIISIHIPIILTVSLPLFLGWAFPQIFTPVHVIFLELVMGPTCSIVYENEPMEKNTMFQKPRPMSETFLTWRELGLSIIQGFVISAGVLYVYQLTYRSGGNEETTRAMVFTTLIFANILLSLANRSFYYSLFESFRNRNVLMVYVTAATLLLLGIMLYVEPVAQFFKLSALNARQLLTTLAVAAVSILWFEVYKLLKRIRKP
ncbi:MAG: cation-translocating P-type ATPase [Weeksellaceae bacterium]|nr:cation-translocating P-type ATPase [Weeksellaceae bacterium]